MAVLVDLVAHRHLGLAVGAQVVERAVLAHLGEPAREPVREHDRQRHQLVGLVDRVAEHHPLIARADGVELVDVAVLALEGGVDALGDVGRLLVQRHDHAARLGVEPELGPRVADRTDALTGQPLDVERRRRRDLAGDDDEPGRDQRLARDAAQRILLQDGVEHGVGDLVGDLVRMTLGHRLGRELELARGAVVRGHALPL